MSKRLFFVLLYLAPVFAVGQNYLPLSGAGSKWQFVWYYTGSVNPPPSWTYYYLQTPQTNSDTVIGTNSYHKLILHDQAAVYYYGAYRSESNGKTWWIPDNDTVEYLLFNLNVNPGDTLADIYVHDTILTTNPKYMIVDSIGTYQLGATPLKMVFISYYNGFYFEPLLWIESLGPLQGFTNRYADGWGIYMPLCISGNDSVRYEQTCNLCYQDSTFVHSRNFTPQAGVCTGVTVTITGMPETTQQAGFSYYPNPAQTQVVIEPDFTEPAFYRLYSPTGQLLLNQRIQGRSTIDVSDLPEGIYLLELETPEGVARQKLVLQR